MTIGNFNLFLLRFHNMAFPNFIMKLREYPLVNSAVTTSTGVYLHVKSSNSFVNSTLNSAEVALNVAAQMALPLAEQFKDPISCLDRKLARGLEVLEEKVPIVKEPPGQVRGFYLYKISFLQLFIVLSMNNMLICFTTY